MKFLQFDYVLTEYFIIKNTFARKYTISPLHVKQYSH